MIKLMVIGLLLQITSINVEAFKFSPMTQTFTTTGQGRTRTFIAENPTDQKIAVQFSMAKRIVDINGKETHPIVEDEFIVYPSQLIIKPKQRKAIRVTWMGKQKVNQELSYRIIAEQLPIKGLQEKKQKGAVIKIILRYIGSVYIIGDNAKADTVVKQADYIEKIPLLNNDSIETKKQKSEKTKVSKTSQKKPSKKVKTLESYLRIVLHNKGTKHHILLEPILILNSGDKKITWRKENLKGLAGENILAGKERQFFFPWPKAWPKNVSVKAKIKFEN